MASLSVLESIIENFLRDLFQQNNPLRSDDFQIRTSDETSLLAFPQFRDHIRDLNVVDLNHKQPDIIIDQSSDEQRGMQTLINERSRHENQKKISSQLLKNQFSAYSSLLPK